jgi:hypothetical protein
VHDRHDDRAEIRRRPERDARFDPVRELEHHDIARTDAARPQRRGERAGRAVDVAERAGERVDLGMDVEADAAHRGESVRHHRAE